VQQLDTVATAEYIVLPQLEIAVAAAAVAAVAVIVAAAVAMASAVAIAAAVSHRSTRAAAVRQYISRSANNC
jgi:hypothetical protein